jgi:hypothetical protein
LKETGGQLCTLHLSLIECLPAEIGKRVIQPSFRVIFKGILIIRTHKALFHQDFLPVPDPAPVHFLCQEGIDFHFSFTSLPRLHTPQSLKFEISPLKMQGKL